MGIDYGRGMVNIDRETGIRFGIIPMNLVDMELVAEFEYEDQLACPKCGKEIEGSVEDLVCPHCGYVAAFDEEFFVDNSDGPSFYNKDGYELMLASDGDIWVTKSPWKAKAGFCSPCAPGAVYLTDRADDAYGYALGSEWFEGDKPPYKLEKV